MKLLIFSELFYPHGGGAEMATWLYSKLLSEKGVKITVVTTLFPGELPVESANGITIYRLSINFMFGSRYFTLVNAGIFANSFISRLIKQSDVVYVPCSWYSVVPVAKFNHKPVIVHLHNYSLICPVSLMYNFAEQKVGACQGKSYLLHERIERNRSPYSAAASLIMNEFIGQFYNQVGALADKLIFVNESQKKLILSEKPTLNNKSCLIQNPIPDIPIVGAEKKGIGYFGGKAFVKGFSTILQALKSMNRFDPIDAYLAMTSDQNTKVCLNNGLTLRFLPKINPAAVIRQISVVVVPSLCPEPSPYVLIESMLYSKLVIASNTGGMPEIVSGAPFGTKLVQSGDYSGIADCLEYFFSLTLAETNELGIKNREYVLKKFDNEKTVSSFLNVLQQLTCNREIVG